MQLNYPIWKISTLQTGDPAKYRIPILTFVYYELYLAAVLTAVSDPTVILYICTLDSLSADIDRGCNDARLGGYVDKQRIYQETTYIAQICADSYKGGHFLFKLALGFNWF